MSTLAASGRCQPEDRVHHRHRRGRQLGQIASDGQCRVASVSFPAPGKLVAYARMRTRTDRTPVCEGGEAPLRQEGSGAGSHDMELHLPTRPRRPCAVSDREFLRTLSCCTSTPTANGLARPERLPPFPSSPGSIAIRCQDKSVGLGRRVPPGYRHTTVVTRPVEESLPGGVKTMTRRPIRSSTQA
jgi:hypothetical protein